jgi:antitoxin (DNA-binding transcriptional repressor) of toxin-antitoxin stability system
MPQPDNLPVPDELAASLRRVVDGKRPETLYDAEGIPVATLVPVGEPAGATAREQFVQQLRAWRHGDPGEQRREWEQLQEVLAEGRLPDQTA